jgi:hypothetical protein
VSFKKTLVASSIAAIAVVAIACTANTDMGQVISLDSGAPSLGAPTNDAEPADASFHLLACVGTECPAPWTTCLSEDGPTYKCGTDLSRDPDNCGACGNKCLVYKPIHMTSRCVDGACGLECLSPPSSFGRVDWRNCNHLVDDGCEVNVVEDPNNCGSCGNVCPSGSSCIDGKCGCPPGLIECSGLCVDPNNDDYNCGACGNHCEDPADACDPKPDHSYYGCKKGQCGKLKCQSPAVDCDGDLGATKCGGNGCEVESVATTENCGHCGTKCTGNDQCIDEGNGPECGIPCVKAGKVLCGGQCVDLLSDPLNCGGCNAGCKMAGPNQARACTKGVCTYECAEGWADCNGDPSDGCETNLRVHPANCGACGNACNIAAGQPCIEGKCLTIECDGGVIR